MCSLRHCHGTRYEFVSNRVFRWILRPLRRWTMHCLQSWIVLTRRHNTMQAMQSRIVCFSGSIENLHNVSPWYECAPQRKRHLHQLRSWHCVSLRLCSMYRMQRWNVRPREVFHLYILLKRHRVRSACWFMYYLRSGKILRQRWRDRVQRMRRRHVFKHNKEHTMLELRPWYLQRRDGCDQVYGLLEGHLHLDTQVHAMYQMCCGNFCGVGRPDILQWMPTRLLL